MKRLLFAMVFAITPFLHAGEPTTIKEVFAQAYGWRVTEESRAPWAPSYNGIYAKTKESASAFLLRVANHRSDADRKLAPKLLRANMEQVESLVLAPAESLAGNKVAAVKALREALKRISESKIADVRDQTEVARLLGLLG